VVIYALTTIALAACGGGGGPAPSATISGSISGLTGTVVLQDNGGDNLTLHANGSFKFSIPVLLDQPYSVTVLTQPTGPNCSVSYGSGTLSSNVTNVWVVCTVDPTAFYVPEKSRVKARDIADGTRRKGVGSAGFALARMKQGILGPAIGRHRGDRVFAGQ
jgi:hypothetical protein